MTSCQGQLTGLISALAPDELLGLSVQEAATRRELADDALQLIADAEAAIDAGEPVDVLTSLVNGVNRLQTNFGTESWTTLSSSARCLISGQGEAAQAGWVAFTGRGAAALGWTAGRVSLRVMSVIEARVSIDSECSGRVS